MSDKNTGRAKLCHRNRPESIDRIGIAKRTLATCIRVNEIILDSHNIDTHLYMDTDMEQQGRICCNTRRLILNSLFN